MDGTCGTGRRDEKSVQGFGGKALRKETSRKIETYMGEWDYNGCYGYWLGV
jgi:hypothetical protein